MADKKVTRAAMKNEDKEMSSDLQKLLFSESFLDRFSDMVSKKVNDSFAAIIEGINTKIDILQNRIMSLETANLEMKELMDKYEQYSRRNNVRLHGIKENEAEACTDQIVIQFFKEKLKTDVPISTIDRSHRVGPKNSQKPRSILIKLTDYHVKSALLRGRSLLKNSGYRITEDLTSARSKLLREAIDKWGAKNVWTNDGRIFIKKDGTVHKVENKRQLSVL